VSKNFETILQFIFLDLYPGDTTCGAFTKGTKLESLADLILYRFKETLCAIQLSYFIKKLRVIDLRDLGIRPHQRLSPRV
jgi:hypothetical protein